MQLSEQRMRHPVGVTPTPIQDILDPQQIRRMGAVEAAFIICGTVSTDEVFVSDVLDVAEFILGPEPQEISVSNPAAAGEVVDAIRRAERTSGSLRI